MFVIAVGSGRV